MTTDSHLATWQAETAVIRATRTEYVESLTTARAKSPLVADMTSDPSELPQSLTYYWLTTDRQSGFYVTDSGYFGGLFSLTRGRGDALVAHAVEAGACKLDCFDGYLPKLYARHGFTEYNRESNWTPGGPDVVYMSHNY